MNYVTIFSIFFLITWILMKLSRVKFTQKVIFANFVSLSRFNYVTKNYTEPKYKASSNKT